MLECSPCCCRCELFCYLSDFPPSFLLTWCILPSRSVLWTCKSRDLARADLELLVILPTCTVESILISFISFASSFWHFRYCPGSSVWLALCPVQLALVFVLFSLRFNLSSLSFVLCCIGAFLNKQSSRPNLIVLWICCRPPHRLFQQHHMWRFKELCSSEMDLFF